LSEFAQTLILFYLSAEFCMPMQRTMLAAVRATDERLIAPTSDAHLCPPSISFPYIKQVLFTL